MEAMTANNDHNSLEKKILDLGEKVLDLPSGYDLRKRYKSGKCGLKDVYESFEILRKYSKRFKELWKQPDLAIPFSLDVMRSDEYHQLLALGLARHEFGSTGLVLEEYCSWAQFGRQLNLSEERRPLNQYLFYYDHQKKNLALIPYLASGDKRFLSFAYRDDTDQSLSILESGRIKFQYNPDDFKIFYSDLNMGLKQMLRNSRKAISMASLTDGEGLVEIHYDKGSSLSVHDNGIGIPKEHIKHICEEHSSGNSGLGLQFVKRFAELRGGHVEAVMRSGNTALHCTDKGELREYPSSEGPKTEMTMYFKTPS